MGKNWKAAGLCVACGRRIPTGLEHFNLCIPCQQERACARHAEGVGPVTAESIIDGWMR